MLYPYLIHKCLKKQKWVKMIQNCGILPKIGKLSYLLDIPLDYFEAFTENLIDGSFGFVNLKK